MAGVLGLLALSQYIGAALGVAIGSSPAAEVIAAKNKAYFDFEKVQLTSTSLERLGSDAGLFAFYDETQKLANRAKGSACKVFPGDAAWPSDVTWDTLNGALGNNALIKTVPLAVPCYNSWGKYDQDKCASLTANWTSSYLQYIPLN
jgi:hypothetical protein